MNGAHTTADLRNLAGGPNQFIAAGKRRHIFFDGVSAYIANSLGSRYIAQLLRIPHKEYHSSRLVTLEHGEAVDVYSSVVLMDGAFPLYDGNFDANLNPQTILVTDTFRDEILPDEDRKILERKLREMRLDLRCMEKRGLVELAHETAWEIQQAERHLKQSQYDGVNVCFDDQPERDRKSVGKAIRCAIEQISKAHLSLGGHLQDSIHCGVFCAYKPDNSTHWIA